MENYKKFKGHTAKAETLLKIFEKSGYEIKAPIDVRKMIEVLDINLKIIPDFRKAKIAGTITLEDCKLSMWINTLVNQTDEYKRLTMAYLLGHFMLQMAESFKNNEYVVESPTYIKDKNWSFDKIIASNFSLELLMPKNLVKNEHDKIMSSNDKNDVEQKMADIFKVPHQTMIIRLKGLLGD